MSSSPTAPLPLRPATRQASGLHLLADLHGCECDDRLLSDASFLEDFCVRAVAAAGLSSVGALFHSFGVGAGVTGVVVLAESHLSVHTWPEHGYVTLDVYVCSYSSDNSGRAQTLFDSMVNAFGPTEPHRQRIERA